MNFKSRFYLILAGIFIASLVSCNLIFQKFFSWTPFGIYTFEISVGILPYPITFLATDLISELYGKKKADQVVISGLIASVFVMIIVLIANAAPSTVWSPLQLMMIFFKKFLDFKVWLFLRPWLLISRLNLLM